MTRVAAHRRAVVTGMGVVAPNGHDLAPFWASVRDGVSAAAPLTSLDVRETPCRLAAEVKGFDAAAFIGAKKRRRMGLATQYAVAAAKKAALDAGLDFMRLDRRRVGVVEGSSMSGRDGLAQLRDEVHAKGHEGVSFFSLMNGYNGSGSGEVAQELGARGLAVTFCSGSASGNDAIGYGLQMIRTGEVDVMLAGGAEAPICVDVWAAFCKAEVMTRGLEPAVAMRPFDRRRDGFLLGEGAVFLVLEEVEQAMRRGARIYAEILAHGRACEAYHSLAPHPAGVGVTEAIAKAMQLADLQPEQVDYINAHGTATAANDAAETAGIKVYFGARSHDIAVSSTKPATGHLLGAAGAAEAAICVLAIDHQEVPPTPHLGEPDERCDLDYVPRAFRKQALRVVLNLNSGFGGKNSCLIIGKFDERGLRGR